MSDFLFRGNASDLDPDLCRVIGEESKRQQRKLILVASESMAPESVRQLMSSEFANIYAEGYPSTRQRRRDLADLFDLETELARYRRKGNSRYYKGVEFADVVEEVARTRAAQLYAANGISAEDIYVNVQPLSGAPANNAVYSALIKPGDTIMGLNLNDGGHLTHGSKVNRSGQIYNPVSYSLNQESEQLDFSAIEKLAMDARPAIIIAGYSAYPRTVDWPSFRAIADNCGALLMADISHISGLIAAGLHPSPIGVADVVTTTTHKSLCGPRGAMILTHRADLAGKIDKAVFPGEQGGPHLNSIAALGLALKLAQTDQFRSLQERVIANADRLARRLQEGGLRVISGGTDNHLVLVDVSTVVHDGISLSGEMAARLLDVAGIVVNRNTIPGDRSALRPSGIRLGTVWVSQLGFGKAEIDLLAEAILTVVNGAIPYEYAAMGSRRMSRARILPQDLARARAIVAGLAGTEEEAASKSLRVRGKRAQRFLDEALPVNMAASISEGSFTTTLWLPEKRTLPVSVSADGDSGFLLGFGSQEQALVAWQLLRDLSDGYIYFGDLYAKLHGPVVVEFALDAVQPSLDAPPGVPTVAPFELGGSLVTESPESGRPPFAEPDGGREELLRTALYEEHGRQGARIVPFAGWEMPVWYSSVLEEHAAVRQTAGLFDVSHMGIFEVSGAESERFLDLLTTNDVHALEIGRSHYNYLLYPDGSVIDDLLLYRRGPERFMMVVNAANCEKDWAWINAVNDGTVAIDENRPWVGNEHQATIRDLRAPSSGEDRLVDIALQGPMSKQILLAMSESDELSALITSLPWAGLLEGYLAGIPVVISRTGYTGERIAYELFVHPDESVAFWQAVMGAGEQFGVAPCGLASRDSTRTEAGLPLYGHELAGSFGLDPADAGFSSYVKLWKSWFVGRDAFISKGASRNNVICRFRMTEKAVRRPDTGDPVLDRRGKVVGNVTSCAVDSEGFLTGLALVPAELATVGSQLLIYQLSGGTRKLIAPDTIEMGKRLPVPGTATVLTRFPSRKKK